MRCHDWQLIPAHDCAGGSKVGSQYRGSAASSLLRRLCLYTGRKWRCVVHLLYSLSTGWDEQVSCKHNCDSKHVELICGSMSVAVEGKIVTSTHQLSRHLLVSWCSDWIFFSFKVTGDFLLIQTYLFFSRGDSPSAFWIFKACDFVGILDNENHKRKHSVTEINSQNNCTLTVSLRATAGEGVSVC